MYKRIIAKKIVRIGAIIIAEGTLSILGQSVREISRSNYNKSKENARYIVSMRRNKREFTDIDWDLL